MAGFGLRLIGVLTLVIVAFGTAGAVWADVAAGGGPSADPAATLAWVTHDTDIDPADVLLVGAGYLFAAAPQAVGPAGASERRVVREEVTAPELIAQLGGRSSTAVVEFDCGHHQSTVSDVRLYAQTNLKGESTTLAPGRWLRAAPVYLLDLSDRVCDGTASRPLVPATQASTPASPASTPAHVDAPASTEAAPPRPPSARRRVSWAQVGAFDTPAVAEQQWTRIYAAAREPLAGLSHRLEPVHIGRSTLQRLLAGPLGSAADAQRVCAAVKASGVDCLVR